MYSYIPSLEEFVKVLGRRNFNIDQKRFYGHRKFKISDETNTLVKYCFEKKYTFNLKNPKC